MVNTFPFRRQQSWLHDLRSSPREGSTQSFAPRALPPLREASGSREWGGVLARGFNDELGHSWAGWKIADPKVMTRGHLVAEELISYVPRERERRRKPSERKEIEKNVQRRNGDIIIEGKNSGSFPRWSRVAQRKRAGPITQRSMGRNHPLLQSFFRPLLNFTLTRLQARTKTESISTSSMFNQLTFTSLRIL